MRIVEIITDVFKSEQNKTTEILVGIYTLLHLYNNAVLCTL
jgi:hypothetical protein